MVPWYNLLPHSHVSFRNAPQETARSSRLITLVSRDLEVHLYTVLCYQVRVHPHRQPLPAGASSDLVSGAFWETDFRDPADEGDAARGPCRFLGSVENANTRV